jgi:hypothetical protein
LIHEDDRRMIASVRDGVGELVDELTVEESTIVTEEHEDGRAPIEQFVQATRFEVVSIDETLEQLGGQRPRQSRHRLSMAIDGTACSLEDGDRRPANHGYCMNAT